MAVQLRGIYVQGSSSVGGGSAGAGAGEVQVQVQCADEMRDFVHCKITAICNKRAKKKPLHRSRRLRRSVNGTKQKCTDEVAFLLRGFCFVLLLFVLFCFVLFWLVG